jgi:hypothetical protein
MVWARPVDATRVDRPFRVIDDAPDASTAKERPCADTPGRDSSDSSS